MKSPSIEQAAAIACGGNVVITARPGSGKTFTLSRMIAAESKALLEYQGVIAISYTRKASVELKRRCDQLGAENAMSFFGTIDGFCLGEIVRPFARRFTGRAVELEIISDDKNHSASKLLDKPLNEAREEVRKSLKHGAISLSKISEAAYFILSECSDAQRYLAARYKSVYVDEYQDCSDFQHLLLLELMRLGLRAVVVGDVDQAIFRYDHRSPEHLVELTKSPGFTHFSLTENRRCHKSISNYSLALLGIPADPIPLSERRVFQITVDGNESTIANCIGYALKDIKAKYSICTNNEVAIIARNSKTLDMVASSIGLPTKRYKNTPLDKGYSKWRRVFQDLLDLYYSDSKYAGDFLQKYISKDLNLHEWSKGFALVSKFVELAEADLILNLKTATAIAELCEPGFEIKGDVAALKATVENVDILRSGFCPARPEEVVLLTYHKAKGSEFDCVFCMNTYEHIMPPYGTRPGDSEWKESLSLHYVGVTRARKVCYVPVSSYRTKGSENILTTARPSSFLTRADLAEFKIHKTWYPKAEFYLP